MLPLVFLGGAIAGAAGLTAAALYNSHKSEFQYSPLLKTPDVLDAAGVVRELNNYFFKAQSLYTACNKVVFDCSELIFTPVPLPWDNVVRRTLNRIGGGMNSFGRKNGNSRLCKLKEEAITLYGRYKGVFLRANELAKTMGRTPLQLDVIKFDDVTHELDNSVTNENWDEDFEALADSIRNFLDRSCDVANQLIDMLEDDGKHHAMGNASQNV